MKNRDLINNSLRAYAALPATRAFLQQYLTRANIQALGQDISALAPGDLQPVAALARGLTASHGLAGGNINGGGKSGKNTPQRRPSVNLNSVRESNSNTRRKSLIPPPIVTSRYAIFVYEYIHVHVLLCSLYGNPCPQQYELDVF